MERNGTAAKPAATTTETAQTLIPPTEIYRGHRQPPIFVRLQEAQNFLADEDYTRYLGFETRLAELEPYLDWCSNQQLTDNERDLLYKVRGMVKVQKEWIARDNDFQPINLNFHQFPPFSTRLKSSAKKWRYWGFSTEPIKDFERPDHPPFTLVRAADALPFLRNMKTELLDPSLDVNTTNSLVKIEIESYVNTYYQVSLIERVLESTDSSQMMRAQRRGVQRRTIEMALNLLADSQEQYHDHDHLRALAIAQLDPPTIPEVRLCMDADISKRPQGPDVFDITLKVLWMQKVQRDRAEKFRQNDVWIHRRTPTYLPAPVNYLGPHIPINLAKGRETFQERIRDLLNVLKDLEETAELAPRPLIRQVILQIYNGISGESLEQSDGLRALIWVDGTTDGHQISEDRSEPSRQGILDEELSILLLLTEPSKNTRKGTPWNDRYIHARETGVEVIDREEMLAKRLKMLSDYLEIVLSEDSQPENTLTIAAEVITAVNSLHAQRHPDAPPFLLENIDGMLQTLHRANIIYYLPEAFEGQGGLRRPWPDHHPEDDMIWYNKYADQHLVTEAAREAGYPASVPKDMYLAHLGFRLGQTIRLLLERYDSQVPSFKPIQDSHIICGENNGAVHDLDSQMSESIRLDDEDEHAIRIPKLKSIQTIAAESPALSEVRVEEMDLDDPANVRHHLQSKLIDENVWSIESYFPAYSDYWDFAAPRLARERKLRIYFSVNRWPLALQTPKRQLAIKKYAPIENPVVPTRKRRRIDPENDEEWWREQGLDFFKDPPREQQVDGPAYFPFGDTLIQQAAFSRQLEEDLKNVPEFAERPTAASRWGTWVNGVKSLFANKRRRTDNPFALPNIPSTWRDLVPAAVPINVPQITEAATEEAAR